MNMILSEEIDRIAKQIVDSAYNVHVKLGPGLLESIYEICLEYELTHRGLKVQRQVVLPIIYGDIKLDTGLRIDMIVEEKIIVELKSVEKILPVHTAQIIIYLKLSGLHLGFLINFNVALIKDGIERVIY